jgi:hypothetical protein
MQTVYAIIGKTLRVRELASNRSGYLPERQISFPKILNPTITLLKTRLKIRFSLI